MAGLNAVACLSKCSELREVEWRFLGGHASGSFAGMQGSLGVSPLSPVPNDSESFRQAFRSGCVQEGKRERERELSATLTI